MTTTELTTTGWWWDHPQPYNSNFDGEILLAIIGWMIIGIIVIAPILMMAFGAIMRSVDRVKK